MGNDMEYMGLDPPDDLFVKKSLGGSSHARLIKPLEPTIVGCVKLAYTYIWKIDNMYSVLW